MWTCLMSGSGLLYRRDLIGHRTSKVSWPVRLCKTPSEVCGEDVVNDQHYLTGFHQPSLWLKVYRLYAFE